MIIHCFGKQLSVYMCLVALHQYIQAVHGLLGLDISTSSYYTCEGWQYSSAEHKFIRFSSNCYYATVIPAIILRCWIAVCHMETGTLTWLDYYAVKGIPTDAAEKVWHTWGWQYSSAEHKFIQISSNCYYATVYTTKCTIMAIPYV